MLRFLPDRVLFLLACIFLPVLSAGQALPEGVVLFAQIRRHLAPQITSLQNDSCYQTSTRYRMQDPKSGRKHRITSAEPLTLEIAHIGGKELFAWPGEGPFESRSAAAMVGGGLTDTGGFSAFARSIFVDNDSCYQTVAVVKFRGKEDWRGRDAVRAQPVRAPRRPVPVGHENEAVEIPRRQALRAQVRLRRRALQRGEAQPAGRILAQDRAHDRLAQPARAIVEQHGRPAVATHRQPARVENDVRPARRRNSRNGNDGRRCGRGSAAHSRAG